MPDMASQFIHDRNFMEVGQKTALSPDGSDNVHDGVFCYWILLDK
jgi:hypothetical protein